MLKIHENYQKRREYVKKSTKALEILNKMYYNNRVLYFRASMHYETGMTAMYKFMIISDVHTSRQTASVLFVRDFEYGISAI